MPCRTIGPRRLSIAATAAVMLAIFGTARSPADDVRLRNGITLSGMAFTVEGLNARTSKLNVNGGASTDAYWLIDDGVRRYFVPNRQVQVEKRTELSGTPQFEFQRTTRARTRTPEVIGSTTTDNWEHGRRTVTMKTTRGPVPIIEEITRLRPDYAVVEGVTHAWIHGIDTRVLPPQQLQELLERSIDPENLDDRKTVVRFYIDAEMYPEASRELKKLIEDFPDQKDWGEEQLPLISEQNARSGMREVARRQAAGQHALAYEIAKKAPPDEVSAEVRRQAQEIVDRYQSAVEQRDRVLMLLEQFESTLSMDEAQLVMPMRAALRDELYVETIDRLEPFLRVADDDTLTPAQKLGLAYSAWVVGPSFADTNLEIARNLWHARFLALEYIQADLLGRREELVSQITALEGVTIQAVTQMIPLLPYSLEETPPLPGEPRRYQISVDGEQTSDYEVVLPPEYHPQHRYPLLVVLRRSGQTLSEALKWWAGDSQAPGMAMRRGYITIAPEFAEEKADDYDYSTLAHERVLAAITDARKKFAVDSNRIFIAGHELGGDACWDMALAHPDLFAGAMPFLSQPDRFSQRLWRNGLELSWYVVGGEKDRDSLNRNARIINNLATRGTDLIYCEYKARGFESYFEELPAMFDWMEGRRRLTLAAVKNGWEGQMLRPTERNFFWLEITSPPERLLRPFVWEQPKTIPAAMAVSSKINQGNTMYVTNPGGAAKIWLSPEVVDFDDRLKVHIYGKQKFNGIPRPSVSALLEDFRNRGDRQRLYWGVLEL